MKPNPAGDFCDFLLCFERGLGLIGIGLGRVSLIGLGSFESLSSSERNDIKASFWSSTSMTVFLNAWSHCCKSRRVKKM